MQQKILILDFGSQYTQLIARRVRELNVYSEIVPYNKIPAIDDSIQGIILSGSPFSVTDARALHPEIDKIIGKKPVLAVCYGAQYIAQHYGGKVLPSDKREYGKAHLTNIQNDPLFEGIKETQVWMSHGDTINEIPNGFHLLAGTESIEVAAYRSDKETFTQPVYCLQFHPEVTHSIDGKILLKNFVNNIAGCNNSWTPESFVATTVVICSNYGTRIASKDWRRQSIARFVGWCGLVGGGNVAASSYW